MILLKENEYDKAVKPIKDVSINNLFARSVVEKHINGTIYVDNTDDPKIFYIFHPYGMSLLIGEMDNDEFNSGLLDYCLNKNKTRDKLNWLQAYPESWNSRLLGLFGNDLIKFDADSNVGTNGKIEEYTRVNFKFNKEKYLQFRETNITEDYKIIRTDKAIFNALQGSVIPKYFWNNADDFVQHGVGFTLINEDKPASTSYSAFIHDNYLELGIETSENCRGKGFALYTCSALIDYCLEKNFEPVWACRQDNAGSYKLAQKLGFEPSVTIPYYRLPV